MFPRCNRNSPRFGNSAQVRIAVWPLCNLLEAPITTTRRNSRIIFTYVGYCDCSGSFDRSVCDADGFGSCGRHLTRTLLSNEPECSNMRIAATVAPLVMGLLLAMRTALVGAADTCSSTRP